MNTLGKQWGMRRLADSAGFFSMLAIDQRPPIEQLIASRLGIARDAVSFSQQLEVKRLLAHHLAAHASAILVDPNYGYPASCDLLDPSRGLLLTLEDHRFTETAQGRLSHSIDNWSVRKIRHLGADAVKVLAWYRPDASDAVLQHQHDYVKAIGQQCREHDIAFIFELLTYPFPTRADSLRDYVEDPEKRPQLVVDSVRAFSGSEYGVDIFKLESPLPASALTDPTAPGKEREQAANQHWFDLLGEACGETAWVMLSAGASMQSFRHALTYALRAGASGFLAGRAVWWDALQAYPDAAAMAQGLSAQSVPYLRELSELTHRLGKPLSPTRRLEQFRLEGQFAQQRN